MILCLKGLEIRGLRFCWGLYLRVRFYFERSDVIKIAFRDIWVGVSEFYFFVLKVFLVIDGYLKWDWMGKES